MGRGFEGGFDGLEDRFGLGLGFGFGFGLGLGFEVGWEWVIVEKSLILDMWEEGGGGGWRSRGGVAEM